MNAEKKLAARRLNWSARTWRTSERGNSYVRVRGYCIVVFPTRKGWGVKVEQRLGDRRCQFGLKRYATRAEAQAAAFDALLWAERIWGGNGRYEVPTSAASIPVHASAGGRR
jgi:hypothetical protein